MSRIEINQLTSTIKITFLNKLVIQQFSVSKTSVYHAPFLNEMQWGATCTRCRVLSNDGNILSLKLNLSLP